MRIIILGHVDFWPNGGSRPQPGCLPIGIPLSPTEFCSHWRSWQYYSESVNDNTAFEATECSHAAFFTLGLCKSNKKIILGYATPTDA